MERNLTLRNRIKSILDENQKLILTWDCGGDQAIIHTFIDGKEITEAWTNDLDAYIFTFLDLPDVGEFCMEGKGEIVRKGEGFEIQYVSTLLGYEGYDEFEEDEGGEDKEKTSGQTGWVKVNEFDPHYSGEKTLFK